MLRPGPGKAAFQYIMFKNKKVLQHHVFILAAVLTVFTATGMVAAPAATNTPFSSKFKILPPLPLLNRGLITHGGRSENKIALTFDLCQAKGAVAGFDPEVVNVLRETKTPATFFLGGLWIQDHMTETRTLAGNPMFELGNHSWSHPDFSRITPEKITEEIQRTQRIMWELLGYQTNLFRLPYGRYSEKVLDVIGENGLYTIQWDVVSGDPDPKIDADTMTHWVLRQIKPGSIVVMHANGRGRHTAEALTPIIQSLQKKGYTFVTISDLLGL